MMTYFLFDGTQSVNGASAEQIKKAFGWDGTVPLWFISVDGVITYSFSGSEDKLEAYMAQLHTDKPEAPKPHRPGRR